MGIPNNHDVFQAIVPITTMMLLCLIPATLR